MADILSLLLSPQFQGLAQVGLGGLGQILGFIQQNELRDQLKRESAEAFPNDRGGLPGLPTSAQARAALDLGPRRGSVFGTGGNPNSLLGKLGETRTGFLGDVDERVFPQLRDPAVRERFAETAQGVPDFELRFAGDVATEEARVRALDTVGERNTRLQPLIDRAQGVVDDPNIISQEEMTALLRQSTEANAASAAARNTQIEAGAARTGRSSGGTEALRGQSFATELLGNAQSAQQLNIGNALERRNTLFQAMQQLEGLQGVFNRNEDLELSLQQPTSLNDLLNLALAVREGRRSELLGFESGFGDFLSNSGQQLLASGQETLNQKIIADAIAKGADPGGFNLAGPLAAVGGIVGAALPIPGLGPILSSQLLGTAGGTGGSFLNVG